MKRGCPRDAAAVCSDDAAAICEACLYRKVCRIGPRAISAKSLMIREEDRKMAPLSILPGRIRFETKSLIGDIRACRRVESSLIGADGVVEASANSRTGRITVRFDESRTDSGSIEGQIRNAIYGNTLGPPPVSTRLPIESVPKAPPGMAGHAVIDMLARAFLPKPFNVLLPMAMHTILR